MRSIADVPRRFGRQKTVNYVAELDGLRCLAIILVLVWHASLRADRFLGQSHTGGHVPANLYGYFPHGEVGVALFFFISGFVVANPFLTKPRKEWKVIQFYWRRLLRIYPPYLVALTGCFIVLAMLGWVPKGAQSYDSLDVSLTSSYVASLFYLHSIILGAPSRLNPPMWSLEIEILFYAMVPFVLVLYTSFGSLRRRCGVMGAVILVSVLANSFLIGFDLRLRLGLVSHLYLLLFGVVVADIARLWRPKLPTFSHDISTVAGLLLLFIAGLCMTENDAKMPSFAYALMLQSCMLSALVCVYVGAMTGRLSRLVFANPWVCLIGTMCYSIYLTHIVVMQALSQALDSVLRTDNLLIVYSTHLIVLICPSILVAFGFYLLVERPFAQGRMPALPFAPWSRASQTSIRNGVSARSGGFKPSVSRRNAPIETIAISAASLERDV